MLRDFFRGRYGFDNFSFVLVIIAILFFEFKYIWVIGAFLAGYAVYRALSKDIGKRTAELQKLNRFLGYIRQNLFTVVLKVRNAVKHLSRQFTGYKTRLGQRKDYVFLSCPKCKKTLRIPKNKGKLLVTCPVCGFQFHKKT